MIERFIVSRDDTIYEAWPDVALTASGRLVCVFAECTHHNDRSFTRIVLTTSDDRGRTWSAKRPVTDALRGNPRKDPFWNCPHVMALGDGRLAVVVDRISGRDERKRGGEQSNWLWFSKDEGETWDGPHRTPVYGVVPDKLIELKHEGYAGRWILGAHTVLGDDEEGIFTVRCWHSDDRGATWEGPHTIAQTPELRLCEPSVMELPGGELVAFLRENSFEGLDAFKAISRDGGVTWEGPYRFPLPGCHRPVAGMLQSGRVLITHRFLHGVKYGGWMQNLFAALTDVESCLVKNRKETRVRIMPLDYDRNLKSDTGYSGWVQFPDGEIYVVNYIVDDAPKAHIRGYAFRETDIILG